MVRQGNRKRREMHRERGLQRHVGLGLANNPQVERKYTPDRNAMLATLRVVLGLPKAPPGKIEELRR